MTLVQLRASLALWKGRLAYRKRRHNFYHNDSKRPEAERKALATKWHKRVEEAQAIVTRRNRQIVSKMRANQKAAAKANGVGRIDGVPVALWMIPYVEWARAHGWKGRVVSGWRDPAYSESLCYRMCGRPSCSGTCAGRASNHSGSAKPHGALDVTEYTHFGQLMRYCPYEPKLINRLPRDRVHYSASGN